MRRSTPLVDQGKRLYGICGTTYKKEVDLIRQEARDRGMSVGRVIGEIIETWAEGRELRLGKDERQGELFE
jgi:hypothetical protein